MIAGIFHQGSGLGNQLFRYIATRVLAADKGYEWMMWFRPDESGKEEGFKGKFFLQQPEWQTTGTMINEWHWWEEKKIVDERGVDIRGYDPEFNFIEDNTIIEGEFQDPRYFMHRIDEVDEWLKLKPFLAPQEGEFPDNLCVIGFRGGEYKAVPDLYLTKDYWVEAIAKMKEINPNMIFQVHTDDIDSAMAMLGDLLPWNVSYTQEIGINWQKVRYAKYAIIANSSFYILPRLLRHNDFPILKMGVGYFSKGTEPVTLAPRYWARRNTKTWALPSNFYPSFRYL